MQLHQLRCDVPFALAEIEGDAKGYKQFNEVLEQRVEILETALEVFEDSVELAKSAAVTLFLKKLWDNSARDVRGLHGM